MHPQIPFRGPRARRPGALAGGTLALAGIGAAATLALSGGAVAPAFAATTAANGTVQVSLNYPGGLPGANARLKAMGVPEQISIVEADGPATTPGAVTCTPQDGASGPTIQVSEGKDGTLVIAPGQSAGNTGEGTYHLASCQSYPASYTGDSGAGAVSDARGAGQVHWIRSSAKRHVRHHAKVRHTTTRR